MKLAREAHASGQKQSVTANESGHSTFELTGLYGFWRRLVE